MYYDGSKVFVISFFVSLITALVVSVVIFLFLPKITGTTEVVVPNLTGTTQDEARFLCDGRGLYFVVSGEEESADVAEGRIARQTPFQGSVVRSKTTVSVTVSKGSMTVTVPHLRNLSLVDATTSLTNLGLKLSEVRQVEDDQVSTDHIVKTIPAAGTKVKRKTEIVLLVSKGKKEVLVPRLIGKSISRARGIIQDKGLTVGYVRREVSTEFNVGIVMSQSPRPGQKVKQGAKVNLVVATVLE